MLRLGFSSCPNDTFVFDAIVHKKIDTESLEFEPFIADVEQLNKAAFAGRVEVSKLSFHAYAHLAARYLILEAGSALGDNNGPLLISKKSYLPNEVEKLKIAIPGQYTTANLLLSIAFPKAKNKSEMLFSDIEQAVLSGKADAGLIIHENRFTYRQRGLQKIMDLGQYWQQTSHAPIPLGCIAIRRDLPRQTIEKVNRVLSRSVAYAFENPDSSTEYVKKYAQEMDENVMRKHIELYVNEFSRNLGKKGKQAIQALLQKAAALNVVPTLPQTIFV